MTCVRSGIVVAAKKTKRPERGVKMMGDTVEFGSDCAEI